MTSPPSGKLVLIIEDDEDLSSVLEEVLRGEGYRTLVTATGHEALEAITSPGVERPAVALLDWSLPDLDPEELAEELNARGVPVVLASGQERTAELGRRIHAQGTLTKPYDARTLFRILERLLGCDGESAYS
jgi:CheY-like chemotaxis protein